MFFCPSKASLFVTELWFLWLQGLRGAEKSGNAVQISAQGVRGHLTVLGAILLTPGSMRKRNARETLFNTNSIQIQDDTRLKVKSWHPARLISGVGCMFISNFLQVYEASDLPNSACTKTPQQSSTSIHSNNKDQHQVAA